MKRKAPRQSARPDEIRGFVEDAARQRETPPLISPFTVSPVHPAWSEDEEYVRHDETHDGDPFYPRGPLTYTELAEFVRCIDAGGHADFEIRVDRDELAGDPVQFPATATPVRVLFVDELVMDLATRAVHMGTDTDVNETACPARLIRALAPEELYIDGCMLTEDSVLRAYAQLIKSAPGLKVIGLSLGDRFVESGHVQQFGDSGGWNELVVAAVSYPGLIELHLPLERAVARAITAYLAVSRYHILELAKTKYASAPSARTILERVRVSKEAAAVAASSPAARRRPSARETI